MGKEKKRKNIVLLMTDQLRGDCMGCAGHPDVKTPYLDTLASKGIRFPNAYSACPSCVPARAALHTGLTQESHRRVGVFGRYSVELPVNYGGRTDKSRILYPVCRENACGSPA